MAEILIAGSAGGREHALGLALAEEGNIEFTHGGNAGTRDIGRNLPLSDNEEIAYHAYKNDKDLVIIGPEAPLVAGLADKLRTRRVPVFGPGADGAKLEASKAFTAEFCEEFGILQPDYAVVESMYDEAAARVVGDPTRYVIKADGLAGGKGVVLPDTDAEAAATIRQMLKGELHGDAGKKIVIQRRLEEAGPEVSAMYVLDGQGNFALMPLSQDHKRLHDGDEGPNTGGMGAFTSLPIEDKALVDDLMESGQRIADGLLKRGIDYRGVVYAGMMLDVWNDLKPSVLEINVRFGDPETQVILAHLGRTGITPFELMSSAAHGTLDKSIRGRYLGYGIGQAAVTVCLAAENYPNKPTTTPVIHGLDKKYPHVTIIHGGTKYDEAREEVLATGGRVLYLTSSAVTVEKARHRVYEAIGEQGVYFEGMQYRTDIANRWLAA